MTKLNITFLFILILILTTSAFSQKQDVKIPIKIEKIYDGDTIEAKIENRVFSIRLIGIDCFETSDIYRAYKQAYDNNLKIEEIVKQGKTAKKYVENLYKNSKKQSFALKGIDKYSRALGIVYFDNINVNEILKQNKICAQFVYSE